MAKPEAMSPEVEGKHHSYLSTAIPWFVRVLWVGYWLLCVYYILRWLIPALKVEIANPP